MAIDKNYAPKLYCSTAKMTEEEWENERRKALGGSDMAVVLGMSPFEGTRLSVYNEKIGKKAVEPMSDKTASFLIRDIFSKIWSPTSFLTEQDMKHMR